MASGLNILFSIILIFSFACSSVISHRPQGDVQTEIKILKEEMKGVKEVQEMEKITIMSINQMVKSVDARVNDAVKESTQISTKLEDLSKKENSHHEEVILHNGRIESLERNLKDITKKVEDVSLIESKSAGQIQTLQRNIETITKKEEAGNKDINGLKRKSEELKNVTDEMKKQTEELKQHTDQEVDSLKLAVQVVSGQLEELKKRGTLDSLHPTGSLYLTFTDVQPPLNGKYGVRWELLPEGYVLMTANSNNVGSRSGGQRLDGGGTQGHTLSISEMPSHGHGYTYSSIYSHSSSYGSDDTWAWNKAHHTTDSAGGDQPHSHTLNIRNQKVMVWKRTA